MSLSINSFFGNTPKRARIQNPQKNKPLDESTIKVSKAISPLKNLSGDSRDIVASFLTATDTHSYFNSLSIVLEKKTSLLKKIESREAYELRKRLTEFKQNPVFVKIFGHILNDVNLSDIEKLAAIKKDYNNELELDKYRNYPKCIELYQYILEDINLSTDEKLSIIAEKNKLDNLMKSPECMKLVGTILSGFDLTYCPSNKQKLDTIKKLVGSEAERFGLSKEKAMKNIIAYLNSKERLLCVQQEELSVQQEESEIKRTNSILTKLLTGQSLNESELAEMFPKFTADLEASTNHSETDPYGLMDINPKIDCYDPENISSEYSFNPSETDPYGLSEYSFNPSETDPYGLMDINSENFFVNAPADISTSNLFDCFK